MWDIVRPSRLVLAILVSLGCSQGCIPAVSPLPRSEWPEDRLDAPYAVTVTEKIAGLGCRFGSGTVIHSCRRHGVFVLTSSHFVKEGDETAITVFSGPEETPMSFKAQCLYLGKYPHSDGPWNDFDDDTMRKIEEGDPLAVDAVTRVGADGLALFRLIDVPEGLVIGVAPLSQNSLESVAFGEMIELSAVLPERFPHRHRFVWNQRFPPELVVHGHSGAGILHKGRVVGVATSSLNEEWLVFDRVSLLRERLGPRFPWLWEPSD